MLLIVSSFYVKMAAPVVAAACHAGCVVPVGAVAAAIRAAVMAFAADSIRPKFQCASTFLTPTPYGPVHSVFPKRQSASSMCVFWAAVFMPTVCVCASTNILHRARKASPSGTTIHSPVETSSMGCLCQFTMLAFLPQQPGWQHHVCDGFDFKMEAPPCAICSMPSCHD